MSFSYLSIINNTKLNTYVAWNQAPHVGRGEGGESAGGRKKRGQIAER